MDVERISLDEWADALPKSNFEVFHAPAALSAVRSHVDGDLHLLAGYKGDQVVSLLPLVIRDGMFRTLVFSPPPGLGIPRLGPLLMPNSPKRRKQERVNKQFTEGVLDYLDSDGSLELFRMVCTPSYTDPRPFQWREYTLSTQFTYRLDLADTSAEQVRNEFSKSLRRDIRDAEGLEVTIERAGLEGARIVYEQTRDRYEEQDVGFQLTESYVTDLVAAMLDANRARVYIARDETGAVLTGITVLYSNDAAYFWQGGARTVHQGVGLNSLLHWYIIDDILTEPPRDSVTEYDLMGANTARLCQYKSKFGAELVPYYVVESSGHTMSLAKKTYQTLER